MNCVFLAAGRISGCSDVDSASGVRVKDHLKCGSEAGESCSGVTSKNQGVCSSVPRPPIYIQRKVQGVANSSLTRVTVTRLKTNQRTAFLISEHSWLPEPHQITTPKKGSFYSIAPTLKPEQEVPVQEAPGCSRAHEEGHQSAPPAPPAQATDTARGLGALRHAKALCTQRSL